WIDAVQAGRNYVSDGKSHLMDFAVNGVEGGTRTSEIQLERGGRVKVTIKAAANLDPTPNDVIRKAAYDVNPFWDLERARIGSRREVPVEVVVNGVAVATQPLVADGTVRDLTFDVPLERRSWIPRRLLPSPHTHP